MFKVSTPNGKFDIRFEYLNNRVTICRISICDDTKQGSDRYALLSEGISKCVKQIEREVYFRVIKHDKVEFVPAGITIVEGDKFDKETGRKHSLKNALEESKLDRNTRTIIWNTYHTVINVENRRKS